MFTKVNFKTLFKLRLRYAILLISFLLALVVILLLVDVIPPKALTKTTMSAICVRANLYTEKHGQPPTTLKDLPLREGYTNSTKDGWGQNISYKYDPDNKTINLRSSGENKVMGDKDDIVLSVKLDSKNMVDLLNYDTGYTTTEMNE